MLLLMNAMHPGYQLTRQQEEYKGGEKRNTNKYQEEARHGLCFSHFVDHTG